MAGIFSQHKRRHRSPRQSGRYSIYDPAWVWFLNLIGAFLFALCLYGVIREFSV